MPGAAIPAVRPPAGILDLVVAAWLDAKAGRSGSAKTLLAYRETLVGFRALLAARGQDLGGPPPPRPSPGPPTTPAGGAGPAGARSRPPPTTSA